MSCISGCAAAASDLVGRIQPLLSTLCSHLQVDDATLQHLPVLSSFSSLVGLTITARYTQDPVCLPECLLLLKNLQALSAFADLSDYTQVQHLQISGWRITGSLLLPTSEAPSLQHTAVPYGHGLPNVGSSDKIHKFGAGSIKQS